MDQSLIVEAIRSATDASERALLRVEELELLVSSDRPRRLIEMARDELFEAVSDVAELWAAQDPQLPRVAADSEDPDVQSAWRRFTDLLSVSAQRSAEASAVIAGRIAVAEDVMSALGVHREYGRDAGVRDASMTAFSQRPVLA